MRRPGEADRFGVPGQRASLVHRWLRPRRRRIGIAVGVAAVLTVTAIVVWPGGGDGNAPGLVTRVLATGAPGGGATAPIPKADRATIAIAAQPTFLIFVAGRSLTGTSFSATQIAGRDWGWPIGRESELIDASRTGEAYWSPAVNSDRTMIVYVGGSVTQIGLFAGQGDIVSAQLNGTGQHVLTTTNSDSDPVWSPDGRQIAFIRDGYIWLMSSDGSHQRALVTGVSVVHSIAWAPNGTELAADAGQPGRIAIINIQNNSFHWFSPARSGVEQYDPSWSPDSKQLVYGVTGRNALFISNLSGTNVRQLTSCTAGCEQDLEPTWSPDGSQIAFVRTLATGEQIYVVPAAGGAARPETTGPDQHAMPSW